MKSLEQKPEDELFAEEKRTLEEKYQRELEEIKRLQLHHIALAETQKEYLRKLPDDHKDSIRLKVHPRYYFSGREDAEASAPSTSSEPSSSSSSVPSSQKPIAEPFELFCEKDTLLSEVE